MYAFLRKNLPNILTMSNLCLGVTAIAMLCGQGIFQHLNTLHAGWIILLACCFDGLDGHTARFLKSESAMGKELDSLSDLVSFGIAPAILLYSSTSSGLMIAASLLYVCCSAWRLARFNISGTGNCFQGLPITLAGACAAIWSISGLTRYGVWSGIFMTVLSLLMISTLRVPKISFSNSHKQKTVLAMDTE